MCIFTGVFEDVDVTHIEGDVNPPRDMEIIFEELRLKDQEYITNMVENLERTVVRGGDKSRRHEYVRLKNLGQDKKTYWAQNHAQTQWRTLSFHCPTVRVALVEFWTINL